MTNKQFEELWNYCNQLSKYNSKSKANPFNKLADKFIELGLKVYKKRGNGYTLTVHFIVFQTYLTNCLQNSIEIKAMLSLNVDKYSKL